MTALTLSVAIGDYDRNRPLIDGRVGIDGVDPVVMTLKPEEIFFRTMRQEAFDICELSLSSHSLRTDLGNSAYVGVPAFLSKSFRHAAIIVRRDSDIRSPRQLEGKRVALAEWQQTANVWVRALMEDHGADLRKIEWLRGGIDEPGRVEKIAFTLPDGISLTNIRPDQTLGAMLAEGEVDAFLGPRMPQGFRPDHPRFRWLFEDPVAEAKRYFESTRIFPIMHMVGIRRSLAEKHPWLPAAVLKAFEHSKRLALIELADTSASKICLPFTEERLAEARATMGDDFWSYGIGPNRHILEYFLDAHHRQGLSRRRLAVEEIFHPSTFETFKI